jgi:hypothetical protein
MKRDIDTSQLAKLLTFQLAKRQAVYQFILCRALSRAAQRLPCCKDRLLDPFVSTIKPIVAFLTDLRMFEFTIDNRACTVIEGEVTSKSPSELKRRVSGDRKPEQRSFPMLLRDHPLMSCYGIPSWPPTWILTKGPGVSRLTGEIGMLTGLRVSDSQSARRCFLYMNYEESLYLGCIFIADVTFFDQIVEIFMDCLNRPISEIGSIDVTHTL